MKRVAMKPRACSCSVPLCGLVNDVSEDRSEGQVVAGPGCDDKAQSGEIAGAPAGSDRVVSEPESGPVTGDGKAQTGV